MNREHFGTTADGGAVERISITGGGLTASFLTYGCVLQDLRLAGHDAPLVLGYESFQHYLDHFFYFGATAGRYANRIAHGRFTLDGVTHQLDTNFLGKHTLHGGAAGIGKRIWTIGEQRADSVNFMLDDPAGAMGFPGNCRLKAQFSLPGDGVLAVRYEAVTDAPTLVNLAQHSYFNLDGGQDILDHHLQIEAQHYLPVDGEMIPTGELAAVDGTPFDFRSERPVRHAVDGAQAVYDHNFCLSNVRAGLRRVATIASPKSGVRLDFSTTEPGLQFYAGHKVDAPVPGLGGRRYGAYSGFCLEAQVWPDSPNHPLWPQAILRPGESYRQETHLRFSREG